MHGHGSYFTAAFLQQTIWTVLFSQQGRDLPTVTGPVIWNSLPASVKCSPSITQFIKHINDHV